MSYHVKLAMFDGPLELLIHLVHKAKIELCDIFVSEITEQYLALMEGIGDVDMDRASGFLNMAARLLYIKSRSLLPSHGEEDEDGFTDPEAELLADLRAKEEYLRFKGVSGELARMEDEAGKIYYKLPEEIIDMDRELVLLDADAGLLHLAFLSLLRRRRGVSRQHYTVDIKRDSFSVRAQKKKILSTLGPGGRMSFFSLFSDDASHMEVAVTFIALLELWHAGSILLKQRRSFDDIDVALTAKASKKEAALG